MPSPKLVEGKYVLIAVLALGIAGSGAGWWYHRSLQRRPLKLWGREAATLFLQAAQVELLRLGPIHPLASSSPDLVTSQGDAFRVLQRVNVSGARGLLHLRHALLSDYSFDWTESTEGGRNWPFALHFRDGTTTATLLISDDFHYAMLAERGTVASIRPMSDGVEVLFTEWIRAETRNDR